MSDHPSSSSLRTEAIPASGIVPTEMDLSCRNPVIFLLIAAAKWLVLSSIFGFLASLKFHAPGMLADSAWATYGRLYPAAMSCLVYGFGIQAALAATFWMFCRLGQTRLVGGSMAILGGLVWNIGLLFGVLAVLLGYNSGYEWLELPRGAAMVLFIGYSILTIVALLTFHNRLERGLYPSQWFLVGSLFWFGWIYSGANLLLQYLGVRGVVQAVTNWWYINNLIWVYLPLVGLAFIFYFIPRILRRPLYSRNLVLFAFWSLVLFGSWGGIHHGAPVPAWLPGLSTVMTVFSVLALIAIGMSFAGTFCKDRASFSNPAELSLKFLRVGAWAFLLAYTLRILGALKSVNAVTQFTYFTTALNHLAVYAFFAMSLFGAIYYIVPRLVGRDWPSRKMVNLHFIVAVLGIVFYAVPLLIGGIVQGFALNDPGVAFMDTVSRSAMFLRLSTLGELLIAIGHLILLMNMARIVYHCCRECCWPGETVAAGRAKTAEVRA